MSTDSRFAEVLELAPDEARRFTPRAGTTVTVLRGQVWLTQEGDDLDRVLAPGDVLEFAHDGLVVVQPLDDRALIRVALAPEPTGTPEHSALQASFEAVKAAARTVTLALFSATERHAERLSRRHPRML